MSKIHSEARSGYITKAVLPNVQRDSGSGVAGVVFYAKLDEAAGATTIADSGLYNLTPTLSGSAAIVSTQAKFGTTSLLNTGTNGAGYVIIGNNPGPNYLYFGSNNWTIEFWVYMGTMPSAGSIREFIIIQGTNLSNVDGFGHCRLGVYPNGGVYMLCSGTLSSWIAGTNTSAAGTMTTGQWYHVAAVRNGTNFNLYVDGTSRVNYTYSGSMYNYGGYSMIGSVYANGSFGSSYPISGTAYMDAIRVVNGTAVYTANFTSPTTLPVGPFINNNVYGIRQLL